MLNLFVFAGCFGAGAMLLSPKLRRSVLWKAAVTPLASIIGSGFLILGPILSANYGASAPLVMAALCLLAYAFGAALRFNLVRVDTLQAARSPLEIRVDELASVVLAFAYIVSVAYYLNLLGAFTLSLFGPQDPTAAKLVTSTVYVLILIVGWTRGFGALEWMEQLSVTMKLSIIAGLFVGLGWYFSETAQEGALQFNSATLTGWPAITLAAGLLVTVQGFETSRYMGATYSATLREHAMRLAQWIATAIYMIYILLIGYVFSPDTVVLSETAIIDMMVIVAPILPLLLIVAAVSAQFSAAVADTSGSGGLLSEMSRGRISPRGGYALLTGIGLALTWFASVFEIISYASRAFAIYYMLQALIAAKGAREAGDLARMALFASLAALGALAAVFGTAVE